MKIYPYNTFDFRTVNFRASKITQKGFTLVEVMVAMTLALLLISSLFPTLIAGMLLTRKSCVTNSLTNDIRHAYDHIAKNINIANGTPTLTNYNSDNTAAARACYFTTVGLPGTAVNNILPDDTSISVTIDGTCHPKIGDLVQITGLSLGDGLTVTALQDNRSPADLSSYTSSTNIILGFPKSIRSFIDPTASTGVPSISAGSTITLIRKSAYAVITTEGENRLVWYEHADDATTTQLVAHGISDSSLQPFSIINNRLAINLIAEDKQSTDGFALGTNKLAYSRASLRGELMFKSGNPFALVPPQPAPPAVEPPVKTTTNNLVNGTQTATTTPSTTTTTTSTATPTVTTTTKTATTATTTSTPTTAPPATIKVDW